MTENSESEGAQGVLLEGCVSAEVGCVHIKPFDSQPITVVLAGNRAIKVCPVCLLKITSIITFKSYVAHY